MALSLVKAPGSPPGGEPGHETCPTCGKPVDALRAGRVALLGERFHYFCDATCSDQYLGAAPHRARLQEETQEPPRVAMKPAAPRAPAAPASVTVDETPAPAPVSGPIARPIPLPAESSKSLMARKAYAAEPLVRRAPGQALPLLLNVLSLSASLVGASSAHIGNRGPNVAMAAILFAFALEIVAAAQRRRRLTVRALVSFLPLAAVVGLAAYTVLGPLAHTRNAAGVLPTAGLVMFGYAALRALAARLHQSTLAEVVVLANALGRDGVKYTNDELVLDGPAFLPVDGVVVGGHGDVQPNGARAHSIPVSAGNLVFAGGKLARGQLQIRVLRTGSDRYVARLVGKGSLHAIWPARYASIERLLVGGTLLASITVGLFAWVSREEAWLPFMLAATLAAVVGMLHRVEVPRLMWARGVLSALEHGVVFPSFEGFDRASFVDQVVLSGRGVVFAGAPTFVELTWIGADLDTDRIMAEIAGAEAGSTHPFGTALAAALRARGALPDVPRRVEEFPGLGVVARTHGNHDLVVGNRELLLRHAISVAGAEGRTAELEEERKELLYVARDGRLVGYAVFEDGVRDGCFAAVQEILGAGMEPVMLSGSSQAVCEAAGRALEIEHVRAEVLPDDRAAVVRSLIESGRVVGMIGTLPRDEDALLEADVGIAFGALETRAPDALARTLRDDLRGAVTVIVQARTTREQLGKMLLAALLLPLLSGLCAGFGLCSPAVMPASGLIGLAVALFLGRASLFPAQNPLPKGRSAE